MNTICGYVVYWWQSKYQPHSPAKASEKNGVVDSSAPLMAAVVVVPAPVAPLALLLTLTALFLPPVLLPKAELGPVAAAKAGKPNETPGEGMVKAPTAGGSAAFPAGLDSVAGAADGSPWPAQQQLW